MGFPYMPCLCEWTTTEVLNFAACTFLVGLLAGAFILAKIHEYRHRELINMYSDVSEMNK